MYEELVVGEQRYRYASLARALPGADLAVLPRSLKLLFENVARNSAEHLAPIRRWLAGGGAPPEIPFFPGRVLMHDTTCVPALADFAALRDVVAERGGDPSRVNPRIPVHLVIDHSVMVEHHARHDALDLNLAADFRRNAERYRFVKWAQKALANFKVVPPGIGILHQVNLELLARVVEASRDEAGVALAYPDTLLGTDSHTPMVNALCVLGWGVGGIEAQAAMLGQPVALCVPQVVGVRLQGALRAGVGATDLALAATQLLRRHGVVGKYVEFFGPGVAPLALADRATVSNMAPEYGATCSLFSIDAETLAYLRVTGRSEEQVALVEAYARVQGLWSDVATPEPRFNQTIELDLSSVEACVAGPRRPHDRIPLAQVARSFAADERRPGQPAHGLVDGAVALAAITSCTNTSNPALMLAAGLLARNARRRGIRPKPWVKTSLSPGSRVVGDYLAAAGLQEDLDALGFHVVGYGCMTCIGNSGELEPRVVEAVERDGLRAVGVLSGNRNFEGRINRHLAGAYLACPALVVAYALAGRITCDFDTEPLGRDAAGQPVYLRELWPGEAQVQALLSHCLRPAMFETRYRDVWSGPPQWQALSAQAEVLFAWDPRSQYVRRPPYFESEVNTLSIQDARALLMLGDDVTTDHISPAGAIPPDSRAGRYLADHGVLPTDLNQYSTRRGNHEVMLRGAFTNSRLRSELPLAPTAAYEFAQQARLHDTPLVILAGRNYGAGSSRDWAAKAPALLGVRVVIAESFERIHRSNLIGMGIVPLCFSGGLTRADLCRDGQEALDFSGLDGLRPGANPVRVRVRHPERAPREFALECRLDSGREVDYLRHGGILRYVARTFVQSRPPERTEA